MADKADPAGKAGFRQEALEKHRHDERYDTMLQLVGTKGWLSLLAAGLLLAAGIVWMVVFPVQERVSGNGMLVSTPSGIQAVLYFHPSDGQRIQSGMAASLDPVSTSRDDYGYMTGSVDSVTPYPATAAQIADVLQNSDLASQWTADGPLIQVFIQLDPDTATVSGYRWSSIRGAEVSVHPGTLCFGQVLLSEKTPLQLILPGSENN
jgi:hypothetical protein